MRILVTAFEPFGGKEYNPSAELLETLETCEDVVGCLLPTSYRGAAEKLNKALAEYKPDAAVLTGVAGGRSEICLEFCALNIKDAGIPDNDGELASGQSVIPGERNALFTPFDLGPASQRIRAEGIPCRVSYHAGTYVCNSTYFHLLSSGTPGVFMHIPDDERSRQGETAPCLSLSDSRRALSLLLEYLRENTHDRNV